MDSVFLCAPDVPSIISGGRVAYLDPQERVWGSGEPGMLFSLSELQGTGALAPLEGIEDFSSSLASYSKTLFRFPLRTRPSNDLSRNTYTVGSITKLVDALKDEAKFLLLFLRSVHTVEVYSVSSSSRRPHDLLFRVQIATAYKDVIKQQRTSFLTELTSRHQRSEYNISPCISNVSKFTINIKDNMSKQPMESQTTWLVANQVGSSKRDILDAARQQCCFPWVGVAMELDDTSSTRKASGPGRVFCFLPMPTETTSKLSVHVNGTFGLNDDRRTIKWPVGEMTNDVTAQWNRKLVTECLPACYNLLLKTAVENNHITPKLFYRNWPNMAKSLHTDWWRVVEPLFQLIFQWKCLWAQERNRWVRISQNVVICRTSADPPDVVKRALTACGLELCEVPEHVYDAINTRQDHLVEQLSPSLVCRSLCSNYNAYKNERYSEKLKLLHYCLSDSETDYSNLIGLKLLPVADKTFKCFADHNVYSSTGNYYICSKEYPRKLLPNIDSELVDLSKIDKELHTKLQKVATTPAARLNLKALSVPAVATLLMKCYPHGWVNEHTVSVAQDDTSFPYEWWETFWRWVQTHVNDLSHFEGQHIVPLVTSSEPDEMHATKLETKSDVVLITTASSCSDSLLEAFQKLDLQCVILEHFNKLRHWKLFNYLNQFNPVGVLNAVANSGCRVKKVKFTQKEATNLQQFLTSQNIAYLSLSHKKILMRLRIYNMLNHGSLMSIYDASQWAWKSQVILEPNGFTFSANMLPDNIAILSRRGNRQELIEACGSVAMPENMMNFLTDILFQMICCGSCPEDKIDALMEHVLQCQFPFLIQFHPEITSQLSCLPFIRCDKNSNARKAPSDLYDSSNSTLKDIFQGMQLFPLAPFNKAALLRYLRDCNLKTTISGQELFQMLETAASEYSDIPSSTSSQNMTRIKGILSYIKKTPGVLTQEIYYSHGWTSSYSKLSEALQLLSKNWLPVEAIPPENYPEQLSWKGAQYRSHLVSHSSQSVLLCRDHDVENLALIVGSQMYFVDCPHVLCKKFQQAVPGSTVTQVFDHYFHVIDKHELFERSALDKLVHNIYKYLTQNLSQARQYCSMNDLSSRRVIWVKKQCGFTTPEEIVLQERSSFPYSLAPFHDILSESLQDYSHLFQLFGVNTQYSDSDIISVIRKIKNSDESTISNQAAWRIVGHVLNWLTDNGETPANEKVEDTDETLLVPVQSDSERPQLIDIEDVVYTDLEFLRSVESEEDETQFIHEKFAHLAVPLGLKALSAHLNVSYDAFDDVGQHEPLITRLTNILKDYKDGLTIIKELLQNADDAGAEEFTICYDTRTHSVKPKSLMYQGMAECHGPALLVHNDASFTDEDFENITKLAGATKMNKPLKIGKFGIGFCSVYHITDVPSFISGKWLYIFDPTIKYLKNEIQDQARPGKKLPFTEKIVRFSKQLVPYKGLFEFDDDREPYDGTLFRFPFRTSGSEISNVIYDATHVKDLFSDIQKAGPKLLLFLSNIKSIACTRIEPDGTKSKLCVIKRSNISESPEILQISHKRDASEVWLVASETDSDTDKPATATVACSLQKTGPGAQYKPQQIDGEMFCYLPLSLQTGLPVHISANFAVLNDRTGIHVSDFWQTEEAEWNTQIMETVIPKAYYSLLLALKELCTNGIITESDYEFYSLWPLKENLKSHNPWDKMIPFLYNQLTRSQLFYSSCSSQWLELSRSCILDESVLLQSFSQENSPPECVIKVFEELKHHYSLINLPLPYRKHIPSLQMYQCTVDEQQFLDDIFFGNIERIYVETRNEILFITLRVFATKPNSYMKNLLEKNACIPCTPGGYYLKKGCEIIDPQADFSDLYDKNDGIFPTDKFHSDSLVRKAMFDLGMIHDLLPWENVLERADTIQQLHSKDQLASMKRAACILRCIKQQIESANTSEILMDSVTRIAFLPVMKRPKKYPPQLTWFGDEYHLSSSQNLTKGEDMVKLAGSQMCVVSELPPEDGGCGPIPNYVADLLGIKLHPNCDSVINNLFEIVDMYTKENDESKEKLKAWVEAACERIYKHFEQFLSEGKISASDLQCLREVRCIWTGRSFISSRYIARTWSRSGPCLYNIPHLLVSKENLITALGIRIDFVADDYVTALEEMHRSHNDSQKPITSDKELSAISEIADKLAEKLSEGYELTQTCYLPDTSGVMRPIGDLAFNDAQWCTIDEDCYFVHHKITRPAAIKLGVAPIRSKALDKYESAVQEWDGVPFGQHEELTQRIQNILSEYTMDITVLKELLQNADDAGATKMYVILDKRKHGNHRLPSSEWKDLQGPALLVWNDRGFSKNDLKGIQRLGLGSKRSNVESIGQYGIGFNVVYHLTDCPSFFTNGNTLCVLDPHRRYVPGANELKPGRMYEGVDDKFWNNWSDLKSTYFRDCHPSLKYPPEIHQNEGTLFRFPLRHSKELVEKSKIIGEGHSLIPLSYWKMKQELDEWAPLMKEALLFLNNVRELKFFVIDDTPNSSMLLIHHFVAQLEQQAVNKCKTLLKQTKQFTELDSKHPFVIHYSLSLLEKEPKKGEEKWLIQQGVGDVQNPQQHWEYLARMKPQHGIAAPVSKTDSVHNCKIFCFLPLPLRSRLPVHVNGKFVLDAARSGLWQSRDPLRPDDKQIWNHRLIEAIASSYIEFLVLCRTQYISTSPYQSSAELQSDITSYYSLFPRWDETPKPEGEMLKLAEAVYKGLLSCNSPVLAVIKKTQVEASGPQAEKQYHFVVEWLNLKNDDDPSKQAYFWETNEETKAILPILKKIGMQLTVAPMFIRNHLPKSSESEFALPEATPEPVFKYYCNYYQNVGHTFPCPITHSVFGSVDNFITFVKYIVQEVHLDGIPGTYRKFSNHPNGIPLLLTADKALCQFSDTEKVICSEFANIFDLCGQTFLHPEMSKLNLIPSYFIEPSEDNWPLISSILGKILPIALTVERVRSASDRISIQNILSPLWKCLRKEKVFKIHTKAILHEWALILSKGNELFSLKSSDKLLPVIPPHRERSDSGIFEHSTEDLTEEVFQIMENCRMPVVDIMVVAVSLCQQFCPSVDQCEKILQNVFYLHRNGELEVLLRDVRLDSKIKTLFGYFKSIHFANDHVSLVRIKSLPLFKIIDGTYRSLPDNTLIWPNHICSAGQNVWMREVNQTAVVFLDRNGSWTTLGEATVLGIKEISPQLLYVQFIFPRFGLLSEQDRLKHLQHIRDTAELFNSALHESQAKDDSERKREGQCFVNELKKLPCLMKAGQLRPISDFYNPNIDLFSTFLTNQYFPPTTMRDSKWLNFLNDIGLRTRATEEEFLTFCRRVSKADCVDVFKASKVLLEYLFKEDKWHDNADFLEEVSEIPFVCAENLKQLVWICRYSDVENTIQKGGKTFRLTSLSRAASFDIRKLVWTSKPVVSLPHLSYHHLKLSRLQWAAKEATFLKYLQVCIKPQCTDVVSNIAAIASSRFSNFKLFDTYTKECKGKVEGLVFEVLVDCFTYLQENDCSETDMLILKDYQCIPVCSDGSITTNSSPVLVNPLQVVIYNHEEIAKFVPFLNPLPECLYPAYHNMLEIIGVQREICFDSIRTTLEVMHKHVENPLDVNTTKVLKLIIKKLYMCLQHSTECLSVSSQDVLYLPNRSKELAESTKLLYNDKEIYKSVDFDLSHIPFSFLSLLVHRFEEIGEYGFTLKQLYSALGKLPEDLRPLLLSSHCVERLSNSCTLESDENITELAKKVKQALSIQDFAKLTKTMTLNPSGKNEDSCDKFSLAIADICGSIQVYSVHNLTVDVLLNVCQPPAKLGTAKMDFLLDTESLSLYFDSAATPLTFNIFESLTSTFISCAARISEVDVSQLLHLEVAIGSLLKNPTPIQIKEMLHVLGINLANVEFTSGRTNFDLTPKLGETIPEELYHRLYLDILNVFRPQEWVAYTDSEDHFIFARIEYRIENESGESVSESDDDSDEELSRYLIIISEDDEIGQEVNIVDLRKILRMKEMPQDDGSTEMVLYDPECESVRFWDTVKGDKLKSMLKEICEELKRIWKIKDKELRRKAIKAMYLKWHPDKNPSPFATKAFQFLQRQLNRLKQGLPLEDPDDAEQSNESWTSGGTHYYYDWADAFRRWDDIGASHGAYWRRERSYYYHASWPGGSPRFDDHLNVNPNPETARTWFKQAECDLLAVEILLREVDTETRVCAHVCFLAHQVAEKALKAGMYKKIGRWQKKHDLKGYAISIEQSEPSYCTLGLRYPASRLDGYYTTTRYPDEHCPPAVPSEKFSPEQAREAEQDARMILEIIRNI
jgi:sacsin